MQGPFEVWRRYLWLWSIPAMFCAVNLVGLVAFQTAFAGNVGALQEVYGEASQDLEALRIERQNTQAVLERINTSRVRIGDLETEHFASEAERFTRSVSEIKTLASKAGLNPDAFVYPQTELDFGLLQRTVSFSVTGSYEQLRLFINYLEISPQFLALKSVSLSEAGESRNNPQLSIRLEMTTIFTASPGRSPRGAS